MSDAIQVVIAEDSAVLRDGLVQILTHRGFRITAAVGDAAALHKHIAEHCPDVAVVDIRMPPTFTDEGRRAALELRRAHPELGILLFSQYVETRYAASSSPAERLGSATCSRIASLMSATSWRRWSGWLPGAPLSTPKS